MATSQYSQAIKERFVTNPTNKSFFEAIQISHPNSGEDFYLVNDRKAWDFTLEDSTVKTHQPYGFAVKPPQSDAKGNPEMSLVLDNTNRFLNSFIEDIKKSKKPIELTYRAYFREDPTTPQIVPPLKMFVSGLKIDTFKVTGRASLVDIIKSPFLHEKYTRRRFPSIGD